MKRGVQFPFETLEFMKEDLAVQPGGVASGAYEEF
jgi:hypothetical protein